MSKLGILKRKKNISIALNLCKSNDLNEHFVNNSQHNGAPNVEFLDFYNSNKLQDDANFKCRTISECEIEYIINTLRSYAIVPIK